MSVGGRTSQVLKEGIHLAGDFFAHAGIEAAIFSGELAANRAMSAHR